MLGGSFLLGGNTANASIRSWRHNTLQEAIAARPRVSVRTDNRSSSHNTSDYNRHLLLLPWAAARTKALKTASRLTIAESLKLRGFGVGRTGFYVGNTEGVPRLGVP